MSDQFPPTPGFIQAPSLARVVCPQCGSSNYTPLGKKGATAASATALLGAGAVLAASAAAKNDTSFTPINYKCAQCKAKFETAPLLAQPDELLPVPCKIVFKRKGSFVGMLVAQFVWLNGLRIGPIGNGKTLEFPTYTRQNLLFVTDPYGVAFKSCYRFEAQPGGVQPVAFLRKFR